MPTKINKLPVIFSKAFQLSKNHFFNSENHFYENLHIETGYSINNIRKEIKDFLIFKDNQITIRKSFDNGEYINLPNYILNTRKIEIGNYWLKEREYLILTYISDLKWYVNDMNEKNKADEKNKNLKTNSPIYVSVNGLAKAIGCTYSEALNSMHKLELYFEGFWLYEENFEERVHTNSRSLTIKLPERKTWKKIIEAKIMEMTGLTNLTIEKPYYTTQEDFKHLKKIWAKGISFSIALFAKQQKKNSDQSIRLLEDKMKIVEKKEDWCEYRDKIIALLSGLVDLHVISEVIERMEFKVLNPYDPNGREQRFKEGLFNLELKYTSALNNNPNPCLL